jgi:aryl-alcohol dehydrogenase-like predicted oxidoreductase
LPGFRFAPFGATPRADQRPPVEGARGRAHVPQHQPALQGTNLDANLALVECLRTAADAIGASVAQVAIAWVAAQGANIVPLVGARGRDRLNEALGALDLALTAEDLASLADAVPTDAVSGERYPVDQLAHLDSEKGRWHG